LIWQEFSGQKVRLLFATVVRVPAEFGSSGVSHEGRNSVLAYSAA
jgi:hypothetical protein